ncbi:hypothetical protein FKM82_021083 [Ascaphus truei]
MAETKIIYHIDEEETPYLVKLPVPPEKVTLADFKNVLSNRPVQHYKFFFKSMDQDFGVVKEEISDDNSKLPCFNGRVVSWLVLAESSHSDAGSQSTESRTDLPLPIERTGGIGDSRPPSFHPNAGSSRDGLDNETGTDSVVSHRRDRHRRKNRESHDDVPRLNGHPKLERIPGAYDSSSTVMSSELESSSFVDSDEDENTSRLSCSTEQSTSSRLIRKHKRRRRKQKMRQIDRSSSFSSITDSTMSLNIITVTLNMEKYNFLGISIVGQSNDRGDGGIYIGSIMKGGAVAADGRIEPGDMLLQVNEVNFENMSNDDAVRVLREIVSKPGPISLTVAKCWDPTPRSYFTIPRAEPVRPIDPAAWITHTSALTGAYPRYGMSPSMSIITCTSSSLTSSIPESESKSHCSPPTMSRLILLWGSSVQLELTQPHQRANQPGRRKSIIIIILSSYVALTVWTVLYIEFGMYNEHLPHRAYNLILVHEAISDMLRAPSADIWIQTELPCFSSQCHCLQSQRLHSRSRSVSPTLPNAYYFYVVFSLQIDKLDFTGR